MRAAATKSPSFETLFRLGCISKLPTVWTNVPATAISVRALPDWRIGAMSHLASARSRARP
jgi:hypothetical protein